VDYNLIIEPGEVVAFVGSSGCGKVSDPSVVIDNDFDTLVIGCSRQS
jgi:ABC-type nitrate/sulfonate/bicarbonate transport system ATPase subunit